MRKLVEFDRVIHTRISNIDPAKIAQALDDITEGIEADGDHYIRGDDRVILFLSDRSEVHFIPGPDGIYGVTYRKT